MYRNAQVYDNNIFFTCARRGDLLRLLEQSLDVYFVLPGVLPGGIFEGHVGAIGIPYRNRVPPKG